MNLLGCLRRNDVRSYPPPSQIQSALCIAGDEWGDRTDHSLAFFPQKRNTREIKQSEYSQYLKAEEILVFNLK